VLSTDEEIKEEQEDCGGEAAGSRQAGAKRM
jgi:hypothetical protein